MYARKNVVPRIEPLGTPALTWYYQEDFPYRTTQRFLLPGKEEKKWNIWLEIT